MSRNVLPKALKAVTMVKRERRGNIVECVLKVQVVDRSRLETGNSRADRVRIFAGVLKRPVERLSPLYSHL